MFDIALVDLRLGNESGLDLIEPLLAQSPRLAIVVITAHASLDTAVNAMRKGAFDYLPKPFTPAQVRAVLEAWRLDYNGVRPHSALANRTPEEFRAHHIAVAETTASGQNFYPGLYF